MKRYRTIMADPAWPYNDKLGMSQVARGAEANYDTQSLEGIRSLWDGNTLAGHAIEEDAFLFLWTTNPFLLSGASLSVVRAWDFFPKQIITWVKGQLTIEELSTDSAGTLTPMLKMKMGMGRITRGVTEQLLVCTRGTYTSYVQVHNERNLIVAPEDEVLVAPSGEHSVKPDAAFALVERLCPGPYLELFARRERAGWDGWGKEYPRAATTV